MLRILIVEDEAHNREALTDLIKRLGHEVVVAVDGIDALEKVSEKAFDLILSDVRMPRMDGLQFFESLKQLYPAEAAQPAFVFMTAYGRLDDAVGAMKRGALHFLSKPLRKKDVISVIEEVGRLKPAEDRDWKGVSDDPVYVSRAFGEVVEMVDRVAASVASVLLVGESGTGKEVLARRLHQKSPRSSQPFIAFHAGAMPESLLESELFGHEKGAFTGAETARIGQVRSAHRGTFFFDEIATTPLGVQSKLLRVLQERCVTPLGSTQSIECDVRWVAATNVALEPLVMQGKFREDLLYRLRVVVIDLPPLRDRPTDIDALTHAFLQQLAERESRAPLVLSPQTLALLRAYSWPGNVRELRNVIERAVAITSGPEFTPDLLPTHIADAKRAREIRIAVGSSLQTAQDQLIEQTLISCNGDKSQAAAILGVAPRTLYRWLERKDSEQDNSI